MNYWFVVMAAGMIVFFIGLFRDDDFFATLFAGAAVSLLIWLVGKETTRQDDRQLYIIGHYLTTRLLPDLIDAVLTRRIRGRSYFKGYWMDL